MCFIAGFGLMLIFGGAHVFTVTRGDEWFISGLTIVMGLWCLSVIPAEFRRDRIDVSVKNKVVAYDGNGHWLVEANTSHNIIGPLPHVTENLPVSLYKLKSGLWLMDANKGAPEPDFRKINWKPMPGNFHVEPRGNTVRGSFLRDMMEGFEPHNYIVRDEWVSGSS